MIPEGLNQFWPDRWRKIPITLKMHPAVSIFKGSLMQRRTLFTFLVSFLLLSTAASAQLERFVGTWEIRKSPTTGKVNLTVNIVQAGDTISGTVRFLNPDGTTTQWPIAHIEFRGIALTKSLRFNTEFKGTKLEFQTGDHDAIMYWSLTLTNARRGFLRGDKGELEIEERVKKKR